VCSSALGGYGLISWTLHPLLLLLGIWCVLPFGLLAYGAQTPPWALFGLGASREARRTLHGAAGALGVLLVVAGYGTAFSIHAYYNHAHLPPFTKALSKIVHIYGGVLVLALIALQAASGVVKSWSTAKGPTVTLRGHSTSGAYLWAAAALASLSGLYIPFIEKGGNVMLGALLLGGGVLAGGLLLKARESKVM
jgi:Eukaryotic cytochrome b561